MELYVLYVCLYAKYNTCRNLTGISWPNCNGTRDDSGGSSEVWYSDMIVMVAGFGVDVCEIYVFFIYIYIYIYSSHYSGVIWGHGASTADSLCNDLFTFTRRKINTMPRLTGSLIKGINCYCDVRIFQYINCSWIMFRVLLESPKKIQIQFVYLQSFLFRVARDSLYENNLNKYPLMSCCNRM